jgi:hypothetical protein
MALVAYGATLYEAVRMAIDCCRRCEHVQYEPEGHHEFTVEPREPGAQHRLTGKTFDAWLRRSARSRADMALKSELKETIDTDHGVHAPLR